MFNYYPKNFKANGWGWHRTANAATAVKGFLRGERGEGTEPLLKNESLYPKLPTEDDAMFSTNMRLYPALPAEEYESGAVEEVIEEVCASINVDAVNAELQENHAVLSFFNEPQPSTSTSNVFSPEAIRPYPKAGARKGTGGRKRRKTAILTDTPEKEALLLEQQNKKKKTVSRKKAVDQKKSK